MAVLGSNPQSKNKHPSVNPEINKKGQLSVEEFSVNKRRRKEGTRPSPKGKRHSNGGRQGPLMGAVISG